MVPHAPDSPPPAKKPINIATYVYIAEILALWPVLLPVCSDIPMADIPSLSVVLGRLAS